MAKTKKSPVKVTKKVKKVDGRKIVVTALFGLAVLGMLWYFKDRFVSGLVNGRPIWRVSLVREMDRSAGRQAFETLVTKKLILAEAKKQNLKIEKAVIEAEVAKLEEGAKEQEMSLNELLDLYGIRRSELTEEIRLQKLVEKMLESEVVVSEEEITSYFEENQDYYEGQTLEASKEGIKEQLRQQKMTQSVQMLIGRLQAEAQIVSW